MVVPAAELKARWRKSSVKRISLVSHMLDLRYLRVIQVETLKVQLLCRGWS